jgi:ubiquinone/menaquinone biosynthesis C-methylase UbiE
MPGTVVVDLCSGDGWFTLPIARIARAVIAVDLDAKLLRAARRRLTDGGARNCIYVAADAYDIAGVLREPVDHVFLANVFHGVPDKPRLAQAVCEALKPGGLFAIVNWHALPREDTLVLGLPRGPDTELRMSPARTIAAVEPQGFTFHDQVEVSAYHYAIVFERRG